MRLIEDIGHFPSGISTVVTSGTFDGVHVGHRKILTQVVAHAHAHNQKSVVITFWPHPRYVLQQSGDDLKLLSTFEEKCDLIRESGIDYLVRIPFTEKFSQMSAREFVQEVLVEHLHAQTLILGYDHHFGKDRGGNFEWLQQHSTEFGFELIEIPRQDIDDVGVSSTKIRKALLEGDVHLAHEYLGRWYSLKGQVIPGDQLGRKLGFPTANLWVPEHYKLIPADGVYAVLARWNGQELGGMANIGNRPTLNDPSRRVEVNLFNFEGDLYDRELEVVFVRRLRDAQKFADTESLRIQLAHDKQEAMIILKNYETD
jgi:riboflavin kinase / FMN adenylyltransferase